MIPELIFAPEVEKDIAEAYTWYEGRRPGLGEEFLGCVDASIYKICREPKLYPTIYDNLRKLSKGFSQAIPIRCILRILR